MKKQFDKSRPFEKRVVVGVAVLFFIVINFCFVFPHFSDSGDLQRRMATAQAKLLKYHTLIDKRKTYENSIKTLPGGAALEVPREDPANQFSREILMQAGQSGVAVTWAGAMQLKREAAE